MKTYLGVSRDHSISMRTIAAAAGRDYNATILATQRAAALNNIPTSVSVVRCGGGVQRDIQGVPIGDVKMIAEGAYKTPGNDTPLFESINTLINDFLQLPDAQDPETSFVVMATTDGQNNVWNVSGETLARRIKELQNTDRWTFVFRVPRGDARALVQMGIAPGNILEWDQTERGVEAASRANDQAFAEFYSARSMGVKSSKTFYTSVANVTEADVKKLGDIGGEVSLWPVSTKEDGSQIRDFVESRLKSDPMLKGAAFYQLVKVEDKIQDYKLIAIRDKESGQIFCGPEARDLIGLPRHGDARVRPDTAGRWQVFVQSTSVNRKVSAGTQVMYWPKVGQSFTEGKSAR